MASRTGLNLSGLVVPLAAIATWQLLKSTGLLPYEYLPSPLDVLAALVVLVQTGELAAWVDNATDELWISEESNPNGIVYYGKPRQYGIEATYRF